MPGRGGALSLVVDPGLLSRSIDSEALTLRQRLVINTPYLESRSQTQVLAARIRGS